MPDTWSLEAARIAVKDPLLECLQMLAAHYGRRTTILSLSAGLPLAASGVTPSVFQRAAERANMQARLIEKTLEALSVAPNLPCLLILENAQACILWDVRQDNPTLEQNYEFLVEFPETKGEKTCLQMQDLKRLYTGYSYFIRPVARNDERTGSAKVESGKDWFWGAFKENKRLYQEVVVCSIITNIFALSGSLYTMNVYDRVVPNSAFETLTALSVGIIAVFIFEFIVKNTRAYFLDTAGRRADAKISAALFEQVMGMTMKDRPASAGILASRMRDFEGLRDFFTSATMVTLIDLPFLFLFIILIAMIAGPLAFIPLLAIPVIAGIGFYAQFPLQKITKQSMNESSQKNALLFETISGLETIKAHAAEGHRQRQWEELTEKSSRTAAKLRRVSSYTVHFALLIQQIVSIVVLIAGVHFISTGAMTMGALIAAGILSSRAVAPLTQVAALLSRLNQSWESLRELDDLMKKSVERPAEKTFVSKDSLQGKIEFQDVIFHYPGQSVPSLNHVTFTINPGDRVAIIGPVGSGKTTLERLLLNLYQPDSGSVLLDGTDVRQIDPADLRRCIGVVQQTPYLFYGSVRENITMGHETIPENTILRAAEISGVTDFLRDTHAGLDTSVGERGEALSGGQRQAVAIARALIYDPSILVLDEPTSAMDPASEVRFLRHLQEISRGKTTLLITHKATMLSFVDKIILIDKGRIVAFGPKNEIIEKLQSRQYGPSPHE